MQVSTTLGTGARAQGDNKHPVFPVGHMVLFSPGDGAVFSVGDVE